MTQAPIEAGSEEFKVLETLCAMPRPVRGMSEEMLLRTFKSARLLQTLANRGLIRRRGWCDGPGSVWVPTAAGEALVGGDSAAA